MQVGRTLRSEHARARSAYPRDPLSLRSTRRTRLSHPAAFPRVHRSNLLYALAWCSSSARTQCLLRSCAPVLWSHATMLGGSEDFSLRCARSCAEHYVGCSHFEAWAPLCACGLCRVRRHSLVGLWHVECSFSLVLWSQPMILGGSDAFSRSCTRWCAVCVAVRSHC